uniref:BRO1 domain-containing protein n=1 Tax=Rhabditophanes sp. KR3021 TaxID=114890 RepID=A0AC35TNB9_9BILA
MVTLVYRHKFPLNFNSFFEHRGMFDKLYAKADKTTYDSASINYQFTSTDYDSLDYGVYNKSQIKSRSGKGQFIYSLLDKDPALQPCTTLSITEYANECEFFGKEIAKKIVKPAAAFSQAIQNDLKDLKPFVKTIKNEVSAIEASLNLEVARVGISNATIPQPQDPLFSMDGHLYDNTENSLSSSVSEVRSIINKNNPHIAPTGHQQTTSSWIPAKLDVKACICIFLAYGMFDTFSTVYLACTPMQMTFIGTVLLCCLFYKFR